MLWSIGEWTDLNQGLMSRHRLFMRIGSKKSRVESQSELPLCQHNCELLQHDSTRPAFSCLHILLADHVKYRRWNHVVKSFKDILSQTLQLGTNMTHERCWRKAAEWIRFVLLFWCPLWIMKYDSMIIYDFFDNLWSMQDIETLWSCTNCPQYKSGTHCPWWYFVCINRG